MKNKSLTPQIRFKGYEDEWQQAKVKDVFTLGNGYTPSKANPEFWTNGTIPWFRMEDIRENGRVLSDSIQHVTPEAVKSSGLFPAGSLIVSTTATIGEHALLIADSLANQQFTVFQTVNRWSWLKAKYLLYRFYGLGDWCRKNVNAGGLAAVSIADLQKYDIDFPSTETERDSIADFFDNIDQLITDSEREITRLEKVKQASLQKMFPRPGETTPEIRFAGFSGEWLYKELTSFVEIYSGLTYTPSDIQERGTLVLRSSNVKQGCIVDADNIYVNPECVNVDNVREGDIIMVVRNGSASLIGKHGQITSPMPQTVIGAFMTGCRTKYPSFVNALFDTVLFSNEVDKNAGATINQITNGMLKQMKFYIPRDESEQSAIGEYFLNLDSLLSAKRQKLDKLQNLKLSCLDKMFINTTAQ